MLYLLKLIKEIVLPPGGLILLLLLSLLLMSTRRKRAGRVLAIGSLVLFYFLSTDFGVNTLMLPLEGRYPPMKQPRFRSPYIVVLTGGVTDLSHIGLDVTVSDSSLRRLVKGIEIMNVSEDAILVIAGGRGSAGGPGIPEALALQRTAKALGISERRTILEMGSRDTWENVMNLKPLLKDTSRPVVLVTSAFHMPRAVWCFRKLGIEVIPAPTDYRTSPLRIYSFVPSARALRDSSAAIGEYLSFGWYLLREKFSL